MNHAGRGGSGGVLVVCMPAREGGRVTVLPCTTPKYSFCRFYSSGPTTLTAAVRSVLYAHGVIFHSPLRNRPNQETIWTFFHTGRYRTSIGR